MAYNILLRGKADIINTIYFLLQNGVVMAIHNLNPRVSLSDRFKESNTLTEQFFVDESRDTRKTNNMRDK